MAWHVKYAPKTRKELCGHGQAYQRVLEYVKKYKRGAKPLILSGSSGIGKTCLTYCAAQELDYDVIEINASDTRNKASIEQLLGSAAKQQSLFFRGRIILVDEVDGVSGTKDRGGIAAITALVDESSHPIIFTANNAESENLKPLRKKAEVLMLTPPSVDAIADRLNFIAKKEQLAVDQSVLKTIAHRCGGDIRAAINDLQTHATGGDIADLGEREHEEAITQAILRVFKTTSAEVALPAFDYVREDPERIMLWLDENIPREYTKAEDLARAFEALAEADKFFGRIRRWQYYRYYVYIFNLLSAGVALAKDEKYKGMHEYKQPSRMLTIWIYNRKNLKRKRLAEQLAPQLHTSTKRVTQDVLPYMKKMWKREGKAIRERYALDVDACEWFVK